MKYNNVSALIISTLFFLPVSSLAGTTESGSYSGVGVQVAPGNSEGQNRANLMAVITKNLPDQSGNIQVTSKNDSTIISGYVDNDRQRQLVSTLAEQSGCRDVINQLKIKPASPTTSKKHQKKAVIIYPNR